MQQHVRHDACSVIIPLEIGPYLAKRAQPVNGVGTPEAFRRLALHPVFLRFTLRRLALAHIGNDGAHGFGQPAVTYAEFRSRAVQIQMEFNHGSTVTEHGLVDDARTCGVVGPADVAMTRMT